MTRSTYFRELDFIGYAIFLGVVLVGWAVLLAEGSAKDHFRYKPRSAAEEYWFPEGKDDNDDKNKSGWERFKDWCSRNKLYIGLGILATLAVVTAVVVYSSGSAPPPSQETTTANSGASASDWKQRTGLDRLEWTNASIDYFTKKTVAQVSLEFLNKQTFFSIAVSRNELTGAHILVKEGQFLKQMLVVLNYYEKNPPVKQDISDQISFLTDFLKYQLHILSGNDQYQFYNWGSMKECLKTYGYYLANWEEAPIHFKTLVNFLTRSSAPGPHKEVLKAFDDVSLDFLGKALEQEIDG